MLKTWAFYSGYGLLMAFLAAAVTIFYGPGAAGSGVPEVMGMMNGVNYPGATLVTTLIAKIFGVVLAVVGNLCVGKEGPLVHIGAIIGLMVPYMPFEAFRCFRNEIDKRAFLAAGGSAGVSAAFGAPIGGALFTYEISKPNTFWTFSMLWRVFFTSAISTFTLGFWQQMMDGGTISLNAAAALKFGTIEILTSPMTDAPIAVFIGIVSGLLGAFFVYTYASLGVFRKKYINTNFLKMSEVLLLSFVTSSLFYWLSAWKGNEVCQIEDETFDEYYAFTCPTG